MRQGRRTAQLIGQQRAAAAGNGVAVDFGSMGDLQEDTRILGFEDAMTIRKNAARESKGYEISAWNRKASASASRAAGGAAMWSAAFDAAGTLLKAGSGFAKSSASTDSSSITSNVGGSRYTSGGAFG